MNSGNPLGNKGLLERVVEINGLFSFIKALVAIVMAFVIAFFILLVLGDNPLLAYSALFRGAFGSKRCIGETLLSTTPLIFGALAFSLAFRCGLFNMGIEGQIAMGGMVAAYVGYAIKGLPIYIHLPLAIGMAALAGAVWGIGPGILKARFGIHEVISTIMLNYIAYEISAYMVSVRGPMKDPHSELPASPVILNSAKISRIWAGTRLHWGIFLALFMSVVVWFLLFKTRLGYKIRAVGKNRYAAEAGGISVEKHFIITMMISGALGGLAGGVEVLGVHYRLFAAFSPGYGWDAIAVGLLGMLHPFGVIASSLLFGILRSGSVLMQTMANVSRDVVMVISAIIIFFMGMSEPLGKILSARILRKSNGTDS